MNIRFNKIIPSLVDGPGTRTVVFLQGCTLACPGCQNKKLWPADGGHVTTVHDLAQTLINLAGANGNITISGGEPFQQAEALARLVCSLRDNGAGNILIYTGYTWEELHSHLHPNKQWISSVLENIDTLVDGRFIKELDDDLLTWRGSRNQRPIDVCRSMAFGEVFMLDWDLPSIMITESGNMIMPVGLGDDFVSAGNAQSSPMCGQIVRK